MGDQYSAQCLAQDAMIDEASDGIAQTREEILETVIEFF